MISLLNKLRSVILTPNSIFELWLRTWYHNFNKTRLFFQLQHWLAQRSYRKWLLRQEQLLSTNHKIFEFTPKVTFILHANQLLPDRLIKTLYNIQNIQGNHWEVIIISPRSKPPLELPERIITDKKIRLYDQSLVNLPDSVNGKYVIFCQSGDTFSTHLLSTLYKNLSHNKVADLIYFDCEYLDEKSSKVLPFFKPSILSPALLLSVNYLSRGFIRTDTVKKFWKEIDHSRELLEQEYNLFLRLCEAHGSFCHIPSLLASLTVLAKPNSFNSSEIFLNHLSRQGLINPSKENKATDVRFTWEIGNPSIAIIILTKNNRPLLERLLLSIFQDLSDSKCHFYIVDNGSDEESTISYYKTIQSENNITLIPYNKPFNYSEAVNLGASESKSDLLLLMNDDMAVKEPDWLSELAQWAIRPEVGVVGGKLLRSNHTIQHAGIILGLSGFMGHIYLNAPDDYHGLFGSVNWYRNYLGVTGACQMIRREVFNEVGGYDEGYQLAFGDIHFCTKVYQQGYQNVYTPFSVLYHDEGKSRGYITPANDALKGYKDMEKYLLNEDPHYSPNLTYTRIPKCAIKTRSKQARSQQIAERRQFYTNND